MFASATASGGVAYSRGGGDSSSTRTVLGNKTAAIRHLQEFRTPIIIDDFHHINRDLQGIIVRALKSPIMHGVPVVIIAIPNRKFDVVKVEREMTGRIEIFEIPTWSEQELSIIATTGFKSLNILLPNNIRNRLSSEAMGSPHLMQEFCKAICEKMSIEHTTTPTVFIRHDMKLNPIFHSIALSTGRSLFDKLAKGPRQRSDRKNRRLKNGRTADFYGVIMEAFVKMRPNMESINYDKFRGYIRDVLNDDLPQMHEVSRVLDQITKISFDAGASTPVIDWDKEEDAITVTDPFFAFYLRWRQ